MPILGTIASSTRQGLVTGSFESIATQIVTASGGANTVTFSNIPSTYTHLQVRGLVRSDIVSNPTFYFNNTNTNLNGHHLWGDGSNAFSNWQSTSSMFAYFASTAQPLIFIQNILDYRNTNKYKVTHTFAGYDGNSGSNETATWSGLWRTTNAITSITYQNSTGVWLQNSHFALYGIKTA